MSVRERRFNVRESSGSGKGRRRRRKGKSGFDGEERKERKSDAPPHSLAANSAHMLPPQYITLLSTFGPRSNFIHVVKREISRLAVSTEGRVRAAEEGGDRK
jgi:hypothetical protein